MELHMELVEDNDKEGSTPKGLALFMLLWVNVSLLEKEKVMVLINEPSAVLLDAIKSGNIDATGWLITQNLKLFMTIKDPSNGRNLLHLLVQYRHPDKSIKRVHGKKEHLLFAVDNDGNNVLHLAAHLPLQFQSFSGLRASKQMLNEVQWFKVNPFISLFFFLPLFCSVTSLGQNLNAHFSMISRVWRGAFLPN